mgnify:CR=1 FL=1
MPNGSASSTLLPVCAITRKHPAMMIFHTVKKSFCTQYFSIYGSWCSRLPSKLCSVGFLWYWAFNFASFSSVSLICCANSSRVGDLCGRFRLDASSDTWSESTAFCANASIAADFDDCERFRLGGGGVGSTVGTSTRGAGRVTWGVDRLAGGVGRLAAAFARRFGFTGSAFDFRRDDRRIPGFDVLE